MKSKSSLSILVVLLTLFSLSAFAKEPVKKGITLDQKAQIAGTQLKPGHYTLKWDNNATPTTNVTFYHGNKLIAKAPAKIVDQKNTTNADYEFNTSSGANKLDRIYFKNEILEFQNSKAQTGS